MQKTRAKNSALFVFHSTALHVRSL